MSYFTYQFKPNHFYYIYDYNVNTDNALLQFIKYDVLEAWPYKFRYYDFNWGGWRYSGHRMRFLEQHKIRPASSKEVKLFKLSLIK